MNQLLRRIDALEEFRRDQQHRIDELESANRNQQCQINELESRIGALEREARERQAEPARGSSNKFSEDKVELLALDNNLLAEILSCLGPVHTPEKYNFILL